jgi:hypothetical protein
MGINEKMIPLVYAIINLSHTLIGIPAEVIADKISKEKVFIVAILYLSYHFFYWYFNWKLFIWVYNSINFWTYVGIMETVQRAIIPKFIPSNLRGTVFGL